MSVCPGSCNTAWRLLNKFDETNDVQPTAGDPTWCERCAMRIDSALRALPHDTALLWLEMEHGTTPKREPVSGSKQRPLHSKEGLADITHTIADVVTSWESDVRERRRYSKAVHGSEGKRVEKGVKFLLGNLPWVLKHHPASVEFGEEVIELHRKAQEATHHMEAKPVKCVGVRCPKCTWKALVKEVSEKNGTMTGYVKCENCQTLLTQNEYEVQVKASYLKVVRHVE